MGKNSTLNNGRANRLGPPDDDSGPLSTAAASPWHCTICQQRVRHHTKERGGDRITANSRKHRIIVYLEQALIEAKELELDGDVVGLIDSGQALTVVMASDVRQCCPEWVRQTCERTAKTKHPIGKKFGRDWIIVTKRLLNLIKRTEGEDARNAAEVRAKKYGYEPCCACEIVETKLGLHSDQFARRTG